MPRQCDLRFTFAPLKGDAFDVVSFSLEEGLSQPFKLELELASHNAAIDFNNVLDLAGLFTIWRDETPVRYVHGLVSLFTQGDTGFRRTRYTAVALPHNLSAGWIGGMSPFMVTWLGVHFNNPMAGLWYPTGLLIMAAIIGVLFLPEVRNRALDQ